MNTATEMEIETAAVYFQNFPIIPLNGQQMVSPIPNGGSIWLIIGPMSAGKSSEMIRRIRRYQAAQRNCVIIKYQKDVRYSDPSSPDSNPSDFLFTHDLTSIRAIPTSTLMTTVPRQLAGPNQRSLSLSSQQQQQQQQQQQGKEEIRQHESISWKDVEVIGIDEGQFYPDLIEFCSGMADRGKIVIVSALDGDYQRRPFGQILQMIPQAEDVVKLSAICTKCFSENAAYTHRAVNVGDQQELIGGLDVYKPLCRKCWNMACHPNPKSE